MRPYVFLAIGAIWLIAAILLYETDFVFGSFAGLGIHVPAAAIPLIRVLFRVMPPLLFLGWVAPVLLGSWLLWKK
ncbi:MAG: hypothetical protein ACLPLR_04705 [Terriglobales bacterium]